MKAWVIVAGIGLSACLGCQTTKPRPIAASDLQSHGVICGSFPSRTGTHSISLRNLDTGKVHNIHDRGPTGVWTRKPEDNEPDPFLVALPPGRYEFYRANCQRMSGSNQPPDWCEFELPFDIEAGQILYLGEMHLAIKPRAGSVGDLVAIGLSKALESEADKNRAQIMGHDFLERDLQILQQRHPEIAWHTAQNRAALWNGLQVSNPFIGKKQGEIIRQVAAQKKQDREMGIKRSNEPTEAILQW